MRAARRGPARAAVAIALVAAVFVPLATGVSGARAGDPAIASPAPGPASTTVATPPDRGPGSSRRVAAARVVSHGPRTDRVVALTFDDGWNARTLRQIYRILVREHVPATFFVTGIYVQRAPALWRQIAAAGFPLANHSYLHRDSRRLTAGQMAADLALTRRVVEGTTGVPMLAAFRPPYGYRNAVTDRRAALAGFPEVVLWDVSGGDTGHRPTVASVVRHATVGRPGSIVLLHAGPRVTPRALPRIIARYRARGFRFVTLTELLGITAAVRLEGTPVPPDPASREVDRREPDRGISSRPPPARSGAGAGAIPPLVAVLSPQPAVARPTSAADSVVEARVAAQAEPPARDGAWARGDQAPVSVALLTVGMLAVLLAAAAAVGRASGAGDGRPD